MQKAGNVQKKLFSLFFNLCFIPNANSFVPIRNTFRALFYQSISEHGTRLLVWRPKGRKDLSPGVVR